MKKRNIKIIYQYDGSKFYGFQRQNNFKTVQGEIEKVIEKSFGEKINMISSGRTDKGVHGKGQVSNFFLRENVPLEAIKKQINKNLKKDIKILEIEEVSYEFNSRYDAKKRTYMYIMKCENDLEVFETEYITAIKKDIDVVKLRKIMQKYVGKHNFSSFMKKDKVFKNPEREVYNIDCEYDKNTKKYFIKICGNSFLKTMVRIMIGSAWAVYFGEKEENYIDEKLEKPNKDGFKILAPSEGLYLYEVEY